MKIIDTLVVTPTLGNRDSLDRTIKSVQEMGQGRVKHIIVTPANECKKISVKYPFIEVIPEPDKYNGIYTALNFAILKYAKEYSYLAFINDDDYWLPDFQKLFYILDNFSRVDVVYGKVRYVNSCGEFISNQASSFQYKAFKSLLSEGIIILTQQATLMRSELFFKVGGFDENYKLIADTKFWMKAIDMKARFKYIDSICAAYTVQEGQLTSNGELQKKEHEELLSDLDISKVFSVINKILFRFINTPIYIKRCVKNKSFKKMETLFQN